jgi:polyvinyl alcohol dehydrogenase (cytochrome)
MAKTGDAIVALDLNTGKIIWCQQMTGSDTYNRACGVSFGNCPEDEGPDFDFGSSSILVSLPGGRRALVAGQKSGVVSALDPDHEGKILWQTRIGEGGIRGGIEFGPAADNEKVYAAINDSVRRMEETNVNGATLKRLILDPTKGGGLFALRLSTGEKVWEAPAPKSGCANRTDCSPAQSAAISVIPGVVFSGSEDGHLRAYSTADGRILWDVDTVRDYTTVNGVAAHGGSLDGPGPTIVAGLLYVNSGYQKAGMPGNVLLAFSVDGK